jgi:hypothetical protein
MLCSVNGRTQLTRWNAVQSGSLVLLHFSILKQLSAAVACMCCFVLCITSASTASTLHESTPTAQYSAHNSTLVVTSSMMLRLHVRHSCTLLWPQLLQVCGSRERASALQTTRTFSCDSSVTKLARSHSYCGLLYDSCPLQ